MGEFSNSKFAARLQDMVGKRRLEAGLYTEIAGQLDLGERGRLLDVGTGTGLQLEVFHEQRPHMALYGLDLSCAALHIAQQNLAGIPVTLCQGSIEQTPFPDNWFTVVTCNASMSYWSHPVACFDEIYRILKPGGRARLFEPQQDVDIEQVVTTIKTNLADKSPLRRFAAVNLNRFGLKWGHTLGLKLYTLDQLTTLATQSRFGKHFEIERTTLQNLPIFARITLNKPK